MLSRRVKNDYTNNNAVQNLFKITTAQIDTTPDLMKENDKSLIESVKDFWIVEDTSIDVWSLMHGVNLSYTSMILYIITAGIKKYW